MELYLGIEFGSTRIKSVLTDSRGRVLAVGAHEWKNSLVGGLWSYSLEEAQRGMQESYRALTENFGKPLTKLRALGISGMMHGYLAFDGEDRLLAPFRTWRNTNTGAAAEELSELFDFNVPMRWSVAQYYQSFSDGLPHVDKVEHLTTLAGYFHYKLSGERVIGANDASGMFPLSGCDYDGDMMKKFNALVGRDFRRLLPKVLTAGEYAGTLTEEGALLLDPTGQLRAGAVMCPPEGDMGTSMIATASVAPRTANISSGTSANMTVILERPLKRRYRQIDVIASPDGRPAALIHTNNCTGETDEWVNLFSEVLSLCGVNEDRGKLIEKLFKKSAESDGNVGGLTGYNYLAGEPLADTQRGAPMIARSPDGRLNLANFMQMLIYSAVSAISLGTDILEREGVKIDRVTAHGGFYKTERIGQLATSAMLSAPVTVMENAGEGGAWGMALLALYAVRRGISLGEFLEDVFKDVRKSTVMADMAEIGKYRSFISDYKAGLPAERIMAEVFGCSKS